MNHRILVSFALLLGACAADEDTRTSRPDAGGDPDVDAGDPGDPTAPDAGGGDPAACAEPVADPGTGNHNSGAACIACHLTNAGPDFTLAGTLYTSKAGTATLAGATVIVVDAAGDEVRLVTKTNGNFYTTQQLTFPVKVRASRCPDSAAMTAGAPAGDCNGCHTASATQGRIHLP